MANPLLCPICREPMEIFANVKGQPWANCFPCGVQIFVHRKGRAVEEFSKLYGTEWRSNLSKQGRERAAAPAAIAADPDPDPGARATAAPAPKPKPARKPADPPAPPVTDAPKKKTSFFDD